MRDQTSVEPPTNRAALTPERPSDAATAARLKAEALAIGFAAAGICDLAPVERDALDAWLARGYAASMRYLQRQAPRRRQPAEIVPGALRAVVVLESYFQRGALPSFPRVAAYARGEDYHRVMGEKLAALAGFLTRLGSSPRCTRAYVDAGPVPERELAARAGLGWLAKNTMLIHPRIGSFTFIGTVFTDLPLAVDPPFAADRCGSCRRCLDACPTGAFPSPRLLDARRCISYLTIEHRGPFSATEGPLIGDWLFGCDICQDVCPWNLKFALATGEPRLAARAEVACPDLDWLASGDRDAFARLYGDTAFARPGPEGMARNARQVAQNVRAGEGTGAA